MAKSIGFLGTGTITGALVTAFCERGKEDFPLILSPRSRERAEALRAAYPARVAVAGSLQAVLDRSEWVVLAVPPQAGESVCRGLRFRPDHKVVSLLVDKSLEQVASWIGPTARLVHMLPQAFLASVEGPILLTPPQPEAKELFSAIGQVVELEDRRQAEVIAAVTGCVTPFYALLEAMIAWAGGQGVPEAQAAAYVTAFFRAVAEESAMQTPEQIRVLSEVSTPGGINLMAKDLLKEARAFTAWQDAMDAVLNRLRS